MRKLALFSLVILSLVKSARAGDSDPTSIIEISTGRGNGYHVTEFEGSFEASDRARYLVRIETVGLKNQNRYLWIDAEVGFVPTGTNSAAISTMHLSVTPYSQAQSDAGSDLQAYVRFLPTDFTYDTELGNEGRVSMHFVGVDLSASTGVLSQAFPAKLVGRMIFDMLGTEIRKNVGSRYSMVDGQGTVGIEFGNGSKPFLRLLAGLDANNIYVQDSSNPGISQVSGNSMAARDGGWFFRVEGSLSPAVDVYAEYGERWFEQNADSTITTAPKTRTHYGRIGFTLDLGKIR